MHPRKNTKPDLRSRKAIDDLPPMNLPLQPQRCEGCAGNHSLKTNGICERFHKTVLQEFYQVAFRKKLYDSIDALQADLDAWLHHYNHERTHQGKMCCGRTPFETMIEGKEIWKETFVN